MRSVSNALLEAIDQRLCAMAPIPKITFQDLVNNYGTDYFTVGEGGDWDGFYSVFKAEDGYLFFKKSGSILAVDENGHGYYTTIQCTSPWHVVQKFKAKCKPGRNDAAVSEDAVSKEKTMTMEGVSLSFA